MGSFAEGLVGVILDGRYRLDAVLGEGGMGAVFRATHLAMERRVAVKLLKPHLTSNEASLQRFAREARSTMKVDSPHAVKVLDYGVTPLRDYYMVLEYLDGRTVQRELDIDGVFSPRRTVHIARQVLHALAAAHATGLVHRDIKPENILLMRAGSDPDYAKVLDFGVAKLMEGAARSDESQLALTQVGTVFGTPEFMSPEQACGHPLDGRSDLYSLAGTMFAMLTGCALFEGNNAIEWLTHHVRTPPPHLAMGRPELVAYPELDELLQRCLAKQRDRRPRSAVELDQLLAKLEPTLDRPPGAAPSPSSRVRVFSTSTFFEPLPMTTVDPGETLLALAPAHTSAEITPSSSTPARGTTTRRGMWLGITALAVLGTISVAIGIVVTKPGSRTTSISRSTTASGSAPVATLADAAVAGDAPSVDAIPSADAGEAHASSPRVPAGTPAVTRPPRNAVALEHLKNAEEGLRTGNRLKQLAEADLALQADPRNVRAKYLLGDALIKSGDLERGCGYLRALGKNPLARSRANAAGCPGNPRSD